MKIKRYGIVVLFIAVLIGFISYVFFSTGVLDREPVVKVKADNCYEETIVVATDEDYRPYSFYHEDGVPSGYDVELIQMVANRLEMNVELRLLPWDEAISELEDGQADVLMTCDLADEFETDVQPIKTDVTSMDQFVAYSKKNIEASDLFSGGKSIGYMENGNAEGVLDRMGVLDSCTAYEDNMAILRALESGELDIGIMRNTIGTVLLSSMDIDDIEPYFGVEQSYMCFAVNPEKPELAEKINAVLEDVWSSGELEQLNKKWLTTFVKPYTLKEVLAQNLWIVAVFLALVVLFVVYRYRIQAKQLRSKKQIEQMHAELQKEHKELEEALRLSQSANRAKTVFLNSMSHDIRTPMNAILGFTALAEKHIDNQNAVYSYLEKIGKSGEHLLSIMNSVLDMSRIESGKIVLREAEESLPEMLKSVKSIVQSDITAKQMIFDMDASGVADERVICDRLRLNQVLVNILSNAIKYTPAGGMISLRTAETQTPDEEGFACYEFRIRDNGMGMSPEFVRTIFDPFTREKTSTVSGIQGTGLGMSVSKQIVDMMKGTICVESEQGKGSEFIVSLRLKTVGNDGPEKAVSVPANLRCLVVDDDDDSRECLSQTLADMNLYVESSANGLDAVAKVKAAHERGEAFDVCLLDLMMPGMNGVETAREIRALVGEYPQIVMLTAYDWTEFEEEARAAGVNSFISKPMFRSDLVRTLTAPDRDGGEKRPETIETANFEGKRLLLVEDNELNREIATEILEEAGFSIDTAEDGTIAVGKVSSCKPGEYDAILMDVQMPIMDGYTATRAIRALPVSWRAQLPILAMTANTFEEDRQKAFEAGMNGFIAKPIDVKVLFETLEEVLK